jgi:membrane protease YdiL (CAAX protease family)
MSWPTPPPAQPPAPAGRPVARHPHPERRSYPLMLRTWTYAWWKPLLGLVLLLGGVMVLAPLVLLPVLAVAVRVEDNGPFLQAFEDAVSLKSVTPSSMLYLNLTLGSAILVTWAIMRWVHHLRPRWLSSVKPGLRWKFFFACLGLAVVALVAQVVVGALLPQDPNDLGGGLNEFTPRLVALAVVILLTTPLQAMGEEYAFRGYAMQAFGSLTKQPWVAIVLTSVLFALAHGVQNVPLFLDRFVFGLMAGFVVWRTGGLEAGIAMHVWNNIVAFGFALAFTDIDSALKVSEVSWWQIPLTLTQNGVYLVLVLLVARRMGLGNRTTPPETTPASTEVAPARH